MIESVKHLKRPVRSKYRKIFASVSNEVFDKFKERINEEGVDNLAVAFSTLVELYSNGARLHISKEKEEKVIERKVI